MATCKPVNGQWWCETHDMQLVRESYCLLGLLEDCGAAEKERDALREQVRLLKFALRGSVLEVLLRDLLEDVGHYRYNNEKVGAILEKAWQDLKEIKGW